MGSNCCRASSDGDEKEHYVSLREETIGGDDPPGVKEAPLCFVDLECLRLEMSIPRCGTDRNFTHAITGEPNLNRCREFETFDRNTTCFVFVSHCWLRAGSSTDGHPDNADNHKMELIIDACDALKGHVIPEDFVVALWMDFMCIDQDNRPSSLFLQLLDGVMIICDIMLTPVYDLNHSSWQYPEQWDDCFAEYMAEEWRRYWSRAWCRLEALLAAVLPLDGDPLSRAQLFPHGALRNALASGHRPHMIYGTKELRNEKAPMFLPPLLSSHLTKYPPLEGMKSVESDSDILFRINDHAFKCASKVCVQEGYVGHTDERGLPQGRGKQTWSSGKIYEGFFVAGKPEGDGTCYYPFWDTYEGQWSKGKRHGRGIHRYANGDMYEGEWRMNKRNGCGRFMFASGGLEDGEFVEGVFVGESSWCV